MARGRSNGQLLAVSESIVDLYGVAVLAIVWIGGLGRAVVAGAACAIEDGAADWDGGGDAADHVFGIVQVDAETVFDVLVGYLVVILIGRLGGIHTT